MAIIKLIVYANRNNASHPRLGAEAMSKVKQRVETDGVWGESEEIELLADMTGRVIAVHGGSSVQYFAPGVGQLYEPPILLFHRNNNHFEAFR